MSTVMTPPLPSSAADDHRPAPTTELRTLVVIPTYNESENIVAVLAGVRHHLPEADVLVVDDNSPDATAQTVALFGTRHGHVAVLRRAAKDGLGAAYRAGFAYGLTHGYDVLVEMDADLSHDPAALPEIVDAVRRGADLAIGSRYVPGASIPDWKASRRALSRYGNRYAAAVLRDPVADLTSGYRAIRADVLRTVDVESTRSAGYGFQIELAHRILCAGGRVTEVPITFLDRRVGESKMSWRITVEAMALVTWWGLRDLLRGRRHHHHPAA
ncbi:MAG: polyprenol monophosphomannose synthase [Acidimicrobiia bacterium]